MTNAFAGTGRFGWVLIIAAAAASPACAQRTYGRSEHRPPDRHRAGPAEHQVELAYSRSRCASPPPPPICHTHRRSRHSRGPCGHYVKQWVPPLYETRHRPCGTPYTVLVRAGYYRNVWISTPRCGHARHRGRGFHYRHGTGGFHVHGHFRFCAKSSGRMPSGKP